MSVFEIFVLEMNLTFITRKIVDKRNSVLRSSAFNVHFRECKFLFNLATKKSGIQDPEVNQKGNKQSTDCRLLANRLIKETGSGVPWEELLKRIDSQESWQVF